MEITSNIVDYYKQKRHEFRSDTPHNLLIKKLIKVIKKYDTDKLIVGIDVGCNVGDYIQNLKTICSEYNSQILCFEPNPVNISEIEKKIHSNENITLYNCALSNVNTVANFYNWKGNSENKIGNGIAGLRSGGNFICQTKVKRLEDVLDKQFKNEDILIKFLKIDVEGNDSNVIKGFEKYLNKTEYIVFECSDCLDDHRGPGIKNPMKDIVDFLSKHNFDTYRIGTKKLFKVNDECWDQTYEDIKFWSNCFSLKKNNKIIDLIIDTNYNYKL